MQFPPELLNQIAVVLELAVACLTALLVAFWIGLVIWTFRDIRARTRDIFAWLLATLLVLVTGPIGLLLYLLLRPRETLAQAYDRQLEEEALLRDITTRRACPSCQAVTEPDWLICPHCRAELRRTCTECGRPLELDWVACPFCATPVTAMKPAKQPRQATAGHAKTGPVQLLSSQRPDAGLQDLEPVAVPDPSAALRQAQDDSSGQAPAAESMPEAASQ